MGAVITMAMLTVLCIVVLAPQALKSRKDRHQRFLDSIRLHAGPLDLRSDPPRPPRPSSPIARRRTVFVLLLVAVAVSAVAAVVAPAKLSLAVHLAFADCLLAYVAQLVRWRDARFPAVVSPPQSDLVLSPAVRPALRIG